MRAHVFETGGKPFSLKRSLEQLDRRTRRDGFHVLHDWDGKADTFNADIIPVDVVTYLMDASLDPGVEERALAISLDYYFFYVLTLLSLRVWDEGDPNDQLDRLDGLLAALQSENGSGQKFVRRAETLLFIATSHFESDESAYDRLLERVRGLDETHRTKLALVHAAILASHLRFGFEATYRRDVIAMRKDNGPDYPWLCLALGALMKAYARLREEGTGVGEREKIVEALANGLTADPRAFLGKPPPSLAPYETERSSFVALFRTLEKDLLAELEEHRPTPNTYSPLSFHFNFPHNVLKGIVVDSLLRGEPSPLTFDDLLTGIPREDATSASRERLAKTLMGYARRSPDTIRGRLVPAIVYDPRAGLRAFVNMMERVRS